VFKIQNDQKFNMADFLQKKFRFFGSVFTIKKVKLMLPRINIQSGAKIQDGSQNVFIV
jgi:hypothetical protein